MSFDTNKADGGTKNIFSQPTLFGETTQKKSTMFGQTPTTSAAIAPSSLTAAPSSLFGGTLTSNKETSSSTSLSAKPSGPSTGSLFSMPSGTTSGFNFGQNLAPAAKNENKTISSVSPFKGLQTTSASVFGTPAAGGLSTPAKTFNFPASTTPAGPPPKDSTATTGSSLFKTVTKSSESSIFGGNSTESNTIFNKGSSTLFSAVTSAPSSTPSTSQAPQSMFSAPTNTTSAAPVAQSSKTPSTSSADTASNIQKSTDVASKSDIFSSLGKTQNTSSAVSSATTSVPSLAGTFSFPKADTPKNNPPASNNTPSTTTATANSSDSFPPKATGTTSQSNIASVPSSKPENPLSFGSSTAGPTPQLTRLKNKTMDEIITRWASDLSKYQKEFQDQASKVAAWDRLMVENGEKIQKLYLSTYEAERQNAEIERQLLNVESQQDEVASWLDKYECEIDEMFSRQVGQGDSLQGPDQEREKTYKLAENLTERLDDMGKNLTNMIDAINDASSTLSKTGKPDDPLSSIVRVLNNHLATLQWIDENTETLKSKVDEAQKIGRRIGSNGFGMLESQSADYFYQSLNARK
ncbi:Nucleoporin nsp1 [Golovinomyces cichoracearum]|uniref:Nucleoporin NSP1 n=1 Tax=Golovinomyces cichoracearum TaxID=62708 RepID=A0A420HGH8_9PEZI|nr:Nucleoporin nsp1 [Golovinomyces cichoracearum]